MAPRGTFISEPCILLSNNGSWHIPPARLSSPMSALTDPGVADVWVPRQLTYRLNSSDLLSRNRYYLCLNLI